MINETELRIGNWIIDEDGEQHQVTSSMFGWMDWSYCKPIALTPEILEKCGFVKDAGNFKGEIIFVSKGYFITESKGFFIATGWEDEINLSFVGYQITDGDNEINYLHQLQNLYFALTGQELEFKF